MRSSYPKKYNTSVEHAIEWSKYANKKASKYIIVRKSGIHNYGAFARRNIKKGTKIIEYTGQYVTKKESDKRQDRDADNGTVYVFTVTRHYDIDGLIGGGHAKLLNHNCEPNCETEETNNRIWIQAMRDIKKGEELGYDYCFDDESYKDHKCKCGAKNCIGFIIGDDYFKKLVKKGEWKHRTPNKKYLEELKEKLGKRKKAKKKTTKRKSTKKKTSKKKVVKKKVVKKKVVKKKVVKKKVVKKKKVSKKK